MSTVEEDCPGLVRASAFLFLPVTVGAAGTIPKCYYGAVIVTR